MLLYKKSFSHSITTFANPEVFYFFDVDTGSHHFEHHFSTRDINNLWRFTRFISGSSINQSLNVIWFFRVWFEKVVSWKWVNPAYFFKAINSIILILKVPEIIFSQKNFIVNNFRSLDWLFIWVLEPTLSSFTKRVLKSKSNHIFKDFLFKSNFAWEF